jgi:Protein of unknown function (DUF2848)
MATLSFEGHAKGSIERVDVEITELVIAPTYAGEPYRNELPSLLTQGDEIQACEQASGAAVPVLVGAADRLWVTAGSDHGDGKVVARVAWRFEEVEPHWNRLILHGFIHDCGKRVPYQEGPLGRLTAPRDLILGWRGSKRLPVGVAMFCDTLPALGPLQPGERFEMELEDPVLGRTLTHGYHVRSLPIVA